MIGAAAARRPLPDPGTDALDERARESLVAIVGSPNVGKSVFFNRLTGRYVVVSNYPGTTVELARGRAAAGGGEVEVIDTPGLYALLSVSEEERVTRRLLLERRPRAVVHVVDAKNLERMLPLSMQLLELGLPVAIALNMMDEARRLGVRVDAGALSRALGVPVLPTVAITGEGMPAVRALLDDGGWARGRAVAPVVYDDDIEEAVAAVAAALPGALGPGLRGGVAVRGLALLLLQGESEALDAVRAADAGAAARIVDIVEGTAASSREPLPYRIALARHEACRALVARTVSIARDARRTIADRVGDLAMSPLTGLPLLAAVVYLGLYKFVGTFGAGTVVDFLEHDLFGRRFAPWFNGHLGRLVPGDGPWAYWARELVGNEYGVVTLGVTYAIAIILPIVSLFFLFFSVLEDSGYFPRLAMLVDRLFKRFGLNGRAVIPVVLGLGCDTMATMVTRIQETVRERVITTMLLALAVPCSAQYGVMTALLGRQKAGVLGVSYAWLAWAAILLVVLVVAGRTASRLIGGAPPSFYMELPPLRWPRLGNVVVKTAARMRWYFAEILPLFLLASVLIWLGRLTGAFERLIAALGPVARVIGLPPEMARVLLFGFFRRDFGAAGLYRLADTGSLTSAQLLVASTTLTLFLPCVAQFLVMKKERGLPAALVMSGIVVATAFAVGGALHVVLAVAGLGQ